MRKLIPVFSLLLLACSGDFWRSCTSTVVGKTVETTKEVSTGVVEGVKEGRKSGESVDGAVLVSSYGELEGYGEVRVYEVRPSGDGGAEVVLALTNNGDKPIRFTEMQVSALDAEGFVLEPTGKVEREKTVPPKAKDRVTVHFSATPAEVRLWDQVLESPK
ncbi:MAG: hypothetical protein H6740_16880 [Alphaproteobacteria bacterium]|nr:hypothetical protein [Alphaproteobacteria bacterium]